MPDGVIPGGPSFVGTPAAPVEPVGAPVSADGWLSVPGGPGFSGQPQPPDVPCDPTGEDWRGPPGPAGPAGEDGKDGTSGSGSGTVTNIATTGPGISGGPVTTTGTLAVQWNAGAATSVGTGLQLSGGVLSSTVTTYTLPVASTSVLGGVKVDGTSITATGGGVISAVAGGAGTVTKIDTSGAGISGGPITSAGTLTVAWNAGATSTIGTGLLLSAGTLSNSGVTTFNGNAGPVTLTSGDVTTALTFTPYNATNPSGYQTAANVTTTLAPYATTASVTSAVAAGVGTAYTMAGYVGGALTASQVLLVHQVGQAVTFPANFGATTSGASSRCGSLANATASTVLTVAQCPAASDPTVGGNYTTIGTLTFSAGGHAGALATSGGTTKAIAAGDFIRIAGPASADATLANVFLTLIANR